MDTIRFTATRRWGDILLEHYEIYIWHLCNRRAEIDILTNDVIHAINVLRATHNSLSASQVKILDEVLLAIDVHSSGLELLTLSHGRLHMDKGIFKVEWHDPHDFSSKEIERLDFLLHHLTKSLLYVDR